MESKNQWIMLAVIASMSLIVLFSLGCAAWLMAAGKTVEALVIFSGTATTGTGALASMFAFSQAGKPMVADPAPVNVHVPEQPAPIVNVAPAAPVIHVAPAPPPPPVVDPANVDPVLDELADQPPPPQA